MMDEATIQPPEQFSTPPTIVKKGGFFKRLFIVLFGLIIFIVLALNFFARPYQVAGSAIKPFHNNDFVLGESITYLLKAPAIGDRVTFLTPDRDNEFIGVIVDSKKQNNQQIYTIRSTGTGQAWEVTRDKIKAKIYFPFIPKENVLELINLQITPSPTPTSDSTANWKTYYNKTYGFSFRYPPSLELVSSDYSFSLRTEPGTNLGTPIITGSITNNQKDFVNDLQYEPCSKVLSNNYKGVANVCIDNAKTFNLATVPAAKIFNYTEIGYGGDAYTIIQTTQKPLLQFKLYFAVDRDGNGASIFDQILSTFKFTEQSQQQVCPTPPTCPAGKNLMQGDPNPSSGSQCPVYQCL